MSPLGLCWSLELSVRSETSVGSLATAATNRDNPAGFQRFADRPKAYHSGPDDETPEMAKALSDQ